ncbi:hypothetical protein FQ154_01695 [Paeniglutamicibacter gangotriensis]|uniref:Uncharacterized protein n=1 Tax=Paeniglutamicibacter gangotriensis TaxID=254787 RepID=A0A5B0EMM4_9MICC|nr:hypothetical protein [Paeniglutamicibacter gangotriensis]KAA0979898.1 hypothetical protein FQ154_01695 [Paeniglutamicibacter gangotriensis]
MSKKALAAIDALAAWINRTPTAEEVLAERMERQAALDQSMLDLMRSVDDPAFLDACASLAQLGMSAADLEQVVHAMTRRRILAFSAGTITDLGEAGSHLDGSTRGSRTYEGDQA